MTSLGTHRRDRAGRERLLRELEDALSTARGRGPARSGVAAYITEMAITLEIWSDIACPWCYVGKRRMEAALARLTAGAARVVWRSFELDPSAPAVQPVTATYAERLARKYRTQVAEAEQMIARMTAVAAADGLEFRFDRIRPGNTFDAHRLVQLARERGVQDAMKERLFRAYLTEGEAIGDRDVLARLAAEVGIDEAEARRVLDDGAYADEVRRDEQDAARLGIHAVPCFVVDRRRGVSGAQPAEVLEQFLSQELDRGVADGAAEGAACGADGCA